MTVQVQRLARRPLLVGLRVHVRVVRNKEGGVGEGGRLYITFVQYRTSLYGHVFGAETTEVAFIRVVTCMASCSPMRPIRNGRALAVLSLLLAHGAHADSKAMSGFGSASLKLSDGRVLEKLKQLYAEKPPKRRACTTTCASQD